MRRGEVLGLRWCDLDLDLDLGAERLSARQALVSVAYEVEISDVNAAAGRRTIDLDAGTVAVLEAWRTMRTEERGGCPPADTDLAFTKPDGAWVHPHILSQVFVGPCRGERVRAGHGEAGVAVPERSADRSLSVVLDDVGGSNGGISGVQASAAAGAPLSEKVPALVERDLDLATALGLGR